MQCCLVRSEHAGNLQLLLTVLSHLLLLSVPASLRTQPPTPLLSQRLSRQSPPALAWLLLLMDIGQGTWVTMPLPMYSTRIKDVLEKGNVLVDLDLFIEETAYHVIAHGDMKSKEEYNDFGRRLVAAYPCLEFSGKKTKWVHFHCFFLCQSVRICLPSNTCIVIFYGHTFSFLYWKEKYIHTCKMCVR